MFGSTSGTLARNQRNEAGENLLHTCNDLQTAMSLLAQGVDVNLRNNRGQVPLHRQMRAGHKDIVLYLLTQTAHPINPNAQELETGASLLHLAEATDVNAALLDYPHINPNVKNNDGLTPLMYAVKYPKSIEIIEALLKHHAINTHITDNQGRTALDYVAERATADADEVYNLIQAKMNLQAPHAGLLGGLYPTLSTTTGLPAMARAAPTAQRQPRQEAQPRPCTQQ